MIGVWGSGRKGDVHTDIERLGLGGLGSDGTAVTPQKLRMYII